MKNTFVVIAALTLAVAILIPTSLVYSSKSISASNEEANVQEKKVEHLFHMDELNKEREKKKTRYLSFLNHSTMHCGVYHLKAGAKDTQSPHSEDEVYYVESGIGKLKIGDKSYECKPGAILFVGAKEVHHFHDIKEDLTLLVFFSKAKPE